MILVERGRRPARNWILNSCSLQTIVNVCSAVRITLAQPDRAQPCFNWLTVIVASLLLYSNVTDIFFLNQRRIISNDRRSDGDYFLRVSLRFILWLYRRSDGHYL